MIGARLLLAAVREEDKGHQGQRTQEVTAGLEGKGANVIHPHSLRHERKPPDDGGQQQRGAGVQLLHGITS